jgi:DNA replicative helicase MCM subunit Mcm2 (Cdc46/Mcm family)
MIGEIKGSQGKRQLHVDFDSYTDNDPDFRKELIDHMVENIRELISAHQISAQQKDATLFLKVRHKVKTTLVMLDDKELDILVDNVNGSVINEPKGPSLEELCTEIINSLLSERG